MSELQKSFLFHPVVQDYADWSSQVIRAVFYPEFVMKTTIITPRSLRTKLEELAQTRQLHLSLIDEVVAQQEALHAYAVTLLSSSARPELAAFDQFLHLYEEFSQRLDRFDIDSMLSDFGVDAGTGLRSAKIIIPDLERELERRARRGQAFSVVLGQIDGPATVKIPEQLKTVATAMRKCLRSFDDAYLSGPHEVLVCLKQTDNPGALRFVDRLKAALEREDADFTMSFVIAEPMPGDDLAVLISNIRDDLKGVVSQSAGEAVEYEEISPLQRFVKSMTEKK